MTMLGASRDVAWIGGLMLWLVGCVVGWITLLIMSVTKGFCQGQGEECEESLVWKIVFLYMLITMMGTLELAIDAHDGRPEDPQTHPDV